MWSVLVCDSDEAERNEILTYIRRFGAEKNQEVMATGCADWPELYERLGQAEPDVILVAQNGVKGLDILTNIHLPPSQFIWFSDLDFSLQAYRLCIKSFSKKPVTYQKVERALMEYRDTVAYRNLRKTEKFIRRG